jgi:dihydropteroate synthase
MEYKIINGRWADIRIPAELQVIEARYDRSKDFEMDPLGYFLIKIDPEANQIRVGFCSLPENEIKKQIIGETALEIINTLVRENLVSSLQHAGDLGIELHKAELALRHAIEYVQDEELSII